MNDVSVVGGKNASFGEMISNLANAGICEQGLSELAQWLMKKGISSVSQNTDTIVESWQFLADESTDEL